MYYFKKSINTDKNTNKSLEFYYKTLDEVYSLLNENFKIFNTAELLIINFLTDYLYHIYFIN